MSLKPAREDRLLGLAMADCGRNLLGLALPSPLTPKAVRSKAAQGPFPPLLEEKEASAMEPVRDKAIAVWGRCLVPVVSWGLSLLAASGSSCPGQTGCESLPLGWSRAIKLHRLRCRASSIDDDVLPPVHERNSGQWVRLDIPDF